MAKSHEEKTETSLSELTRATIYTPGGYRAPCDPPAIPAELALKWGLALLGEEKAAEYLAWLRSRLGTDSRQDSQTFV